MDLIWHIPARNVVPGALAGVVVCLVGCVPLSPAKKPDSSQLPPVRLPPDAVVVDIAFVRLPPGDHESYDEIWNAADEQSLSVETRRELAANGIRAGVYGQELPPRLRSLLDAPQAKISDLSEAGSDFEISTRQHLPLRAGHRSVIQVSPVFPSLAVLTTESGSVRGYQLVEARCTLALKAYPQGDGRAKLCLTPAIEHGESKSRWVGSEGMMIQQTGQERLVLDRLALDTTLSPGQWLILSTTADVKGLGEHFFAHKSGGAVHRRALVIRYSQTQFDDLFAPEQTTARLATPAE
jgi:hypothetical protein